MCIPLCTTVVHNTARNNPDNIPTLPPDNHHSSDAVYRRRGAVECCCVCYHWPWSDTAQSNCTGLTSLTGCSSVLPWYSSVWTAAHHCICWSTASQYPVLTRTGICVPRFRLNTYGHLAFSSAGKTAWNSLPDFIRDATNSTDCFRHLLKMYLFTQYQHIRGS